MLLYYSNNFTRRQRTEVGSRRPQSLLDELRVVRLAEGEVGHQLVERARPTFVIEPRVVEENLVVQVHSTFGCRQMERQVTEFTQVVPVLTTAAPLFELSKQQGRILLVPTLRMDHH